MLLISDPTLKVNCHISMELCCNCERIFALQHIGYKTALRPAAKQWVSVRPKSGGGKWTGAHVLSSLGAMALATPAWAQDAPHWSSPVIDMHFHMRRTPELNIAHQVGAGVTAANLLTRYDSAPAADRPAGTEPDHVSQLVRLGRCRQAGRRSSF